MFDLGWSWTQQDTGPPGPTTLPFPDADNTKVLNNVTFSFLFYAFIQSDL